MSKKLTKLFAVLSLALLVLMVFAAPVLAQEEFQFDGGDAGAGFGFVALCCGGLSAIVGLALFVLWIWMLIDCVKRPDEQFEGGMSKVVWIILMVVFSYITAIVYYFVMYRKLGSA